MTILTEPNSLWEPTEEYRRRSRLLRFMRRHGIETYVDLYRRSVADIAWYWDSVVRDELELRWKVPYRQVLDLSDGPAWPHWFVGGRINYVENAVDRHAQGGQAQKPAILWEGEDGTVRRYSYAELHREVSRIAAGLRGLGIRKGDRVGLFLPMLPEAAIALLACGKIGAIAVPMFSGYGPEGVATRLQDAEARVLITVDATLRRGKIIAMKEVADAAAAVSPSIEHVVVVEHCSVGMPWEPGRDILWNSLDSHVADVATEDTAAEDPFLIIFTSGTTGRPKGTVHVHGGFPIKAAQDMAHCFDVHPEDILFWYTDMGWVMGPLTIIATLTLGATLLLYDGAPDFPDANRLWRMVERHGISTLGLSPTLIRSLMTTAAIDPSGHDLSSLCVLGSTGEPQSPDAWSWYFHEVGQDRCPIINYSGGTEATGGILSCTTIQPIRASSFSTPTPGMAADVVDDQGFSIRGQVGELVVRQPWVGMTRGFWREPERYIETYWDRFPGVWDHGDWALVDEDGFWYIRGRSDDTLKLAGKRVGPAEIESAAMTHLSVQTVAAVGIPDAMKYEAVILFVVLREGYLPSDLLREEIRREVGERLGKALLPADVRFVSDLPRTRSGKVMRRLIRASFLGHDPGDMSSLENPQAIEAIRASI